MRPTPEEIEDVRLNSNAWKWLERLKGNLRRLEETESILSEEHFFAQLEMGLKIYNNHPSICPKCKATFSSWKDTNTHIRHSHRDMHLLLQFISTGEMISQDIQKQDLIESQRQELKNADLFERISTYNMLRMFMDDPTETGDTGNKRRRRLIELGLVRQEWGDIPYPTRIARELLENPPVL